MKDRVLPVYLMLLCSSLLGMQLVLVTSSCAIGEKLDAIEDINLAACINDCSNSKLDTCLDSVEENECFQELEACFDQVSLCNDICINCEEEGLCENEDECSSACNKLANGCTDSIDDCADGLKESAQTALVEECIKPYGACVAACIEIVEDALD